MAQVATAIARIEAACKAKPESSSDSKVQPSTPKDVPTGYRNPVLAAVKLEAEEQRKLKGEEASEEQNTDVCAGEIVSVKDNQDTKKAEAEEPEQVLVQEQEQQKPWEDEWHDVSIEESSSNFARNEEEIKITSPTQDENTEACSESSGGSPINTADATSGSASNIDISGYGDLSGSADSGKIASSVEGLDEDAEAEICRRLSAIEESQRRLEDKVIAMHAEEIAALRAQIYAGASGRAIASGNKPPAYPQATSGATPLAAEVVSLDEVEAAMLQHPAVEVARAFGRVHPTNGAEVYCAIKMKDGAKVTEQWLKLHAQSNLTNSSVPKRFYVHDNLMAETPRDVLAADNGLRRAPSRSGLKLGRVAQLKTPSWIPSIKHRA